MVNFTTDTEERQRWVMAISNDYATLEKRKKIWVFANHFDCEWMTMRGRKRLSQPNSVFSSVLKSSMKQRQEADAE